MQFTTHIISILILTDNNQDIQQMSVIVKPIKAQLLHNTDFFGKADPYVVCTLGHEKVKGKKHSNAGKHPKWNDIFTFTTTSNIMIVQVWDYDRFKPDDLMGVGTCDMRDIFAHPNQTKTFDISLVMDGKPAGNIQLVVVYTGQPLCPRFGYRSVDKNSNKINPNLPNYQASTSLPHGNGKTCQKVNWDA